MEGNWEESWQRARRVEEWVGFLPLLGEGSWEGACPASDFGGKATGSPVGPEANPRPPNSFAVV